MEKLTSYRKKRNFDRTEEPSGAKVGVSKKKSLKFVVQYHEARRNHFDFRLEWQGVLLSWAVPKGPSFCPQDKRLAVKVEDHPVEYADFEGAIPKGEYGGGPVIIWDEGNWVPSLDVNAGLSEGALKFELFGKRLQGKWTLVRLDGADEKDNWLLIKEKDEFALKDSGIQGFVTSIRSGRTAEELRNAEDPNSKKNPFKTTEVQLCKLCKEPPVGKEWFFEVKYDGYRILTYCEGGKVRFVTRNGKDFTDKFSQVSVEIAKWSRGRAIILDGEMVVPDENGRTDFQALQNFIKRPEGKSLVYMAFDLLAYNGEDMRKLTLRKRKAKLEELLSDAPDCLKYSVHVEGRGKESLAVAEENGFEGIVGKLADSVYSGNRNGDWIKIKCYNRQEFVIGGFTRTEKKEEGISSILLGIYENGKLRFVGRAGTGLSKKSSLNLLKKFDGLITEKPYFENPPKEAKAERIFWLIPELLAEVQYAEWTSDNFLRQASFKGLREDKYPEEIFRETAETEAPSTFDKSGNEDAVSVYGIEISNPERIIFQKPEVKKIDVVRYYEAVAERMLEVTGGRVLSVVRCHNGVSSECFFKKHADKVGLGKETVKVTDSEGKVSDYFCIKDIQGLISEVQLGTVEFHVWGSMVENLESPDMMVFDLDPDEKMSIEKVRQGVRDLKEILDSLSLASFLKVSGGKGYHVVVPFIPRADWNSFHDFARKIAELMESKWTDRYTSNMRKSKRKGRIFIDWVRNGRGATSVAPYSLRARPGAKVSAPIFWEELDEIAPDGIDMFEAMKRLSKEDPWKDFFKSGKSLY